MSFDFKWPEFSPSFYDHAKHLLSTALNKGEKPPIIADKIQVNQLDMGTIPPDLEILEIGDLGRDRFRGIFRMTYAGDASICLQTKVQANPLRQETNTSTPDILTTPSILFASTPLIVPMTLSLSSLKLRAIVVLVISRLEGVTLVFKNDPLESVQVSSTFDSLAAIQTFLQSEIERQLRDLFRTELPAIIHQLSRQWLKSHNTDAQSVVYSQLPPCSNDTTPLTHPAPVTPTPSDLNSMSSVPDEIESYDPTYGLRPSHPPLVGSFTRYRMLIKQQNRKLGLGAALTEADDDDDDGDQIKEEILSTASTLSLDDSKDRPAIASPQSDQKKKYTGIGTKKMAKPKIFHSHSVGIVNSDVSSCGLSSHLGHQGTRSSSRVMNLNRPMSLNGLDENQQEEGEVLRSRRLERFSMHSPSASTNLLPTMGAGREKIEATKASLPHMTTSPLNPFYGRAGVRPPSSIFPSTQRSSMTCLPAYTSQCGSPVKDCTCSANFLTSRFNSVTKEEYKLDELDDQVEIDEDSQCALLASLVRGNWTLSPFSRSISHFAARSTPLSGKSEMLGSSNCSRLKSPPHRLASRLKEEIPHHPTSSIYSQCSDDFKKHQSRSSRLESGLDGFIQKRVTKIKKID